FDSNANLWTVTDISSSSLNKDAWTSFGNNGMFVIPTIGSDKGIAFQFASAPAEAELTGPSFNPDEKTLFLSIQHPGEETKDKNNPTSTWPHRKGEKTPRPAVVAITGFKF
ncbi:alkaline phosphatase PhoX, partial [Neobacillus niacini]|uniref:alkaline phosphatase PhoX n=1 Tax=Neobacillus niacini TaxID=86668 RepID=UPI002FFE9123